MTLKQIQRFIELNLQSPKVGLFLRPLNTGIPGSINRKGKENAANYRNAFCADA